MSKIRDFINKYKISFKRVGWILLVAIFEMILIAWGNGWIINLAVLAPLIQFIAVIKKRSGFYDLNEEEQDEYTLSEKEFGDFVKSIAEKLAYMSIEDILKEIKK